MKSYSAQVKETLNSLIRDISQHAWLYAKDPKRDFTRSRKLPFEEMIRILLGITSADKDRKDEGDGRNWRQQKGDAVIFA